MRITISPKGSMSLLSQIEIERLQHAKKSSLYQLFRRCVLAVLNVGVHTDNADEIEEKHQNFDVKLIRRERGVKLELINPPEQAFVDGQLVEGIREHVESVLRDILFVGEQYSEELLNKADSRHLTHLVFNVLRNANTLKPISILDMVVCWGGHSISDEEYKYSKDVGYELGLRGFNICTGCGPGAMKGPMKGATIGHAKQRIKSARYLGITEPSIIAAEPPNPIVNELVIMPDIEKRLEAFVRLAHAVIIFPGGAGTAEELLYILGILLHPKNKEHPLPIVLTGPESSREYFKQIDTFIRDTLGQEATNKYRIIIQNPAQVAQYIQYQTDTVRQHRLHLGDAYYFNWTLHIDPIFQVPFIPTHEHVAQLDLHYERPKEQLAADLRRAFSAIVAGNVKADYIALIKQQGVYQVNGDPHLMDALDKLLDSFVQANRMKLPSDEPYQPCYIISKGTVSL